MLTKFLPKGARRTHMTRREERELVFKLLFETEFHGGSNPANVYAESLLTENLKETPYIRDTYFGTVDSLSETDALITENAHKWRVSRMAVVTRTILRLAVYEMSHGGIPAKAAINEAVELSKIYDDEAAASFINGILNQVARKQGLIQEIASEEML